MERNNNNTDDDDNEDLVLCLKKSCFCLEVTERVASLQIDLPQEDQVSLVTFPKKEPSGPSEQETKKKSAGSGPQG
jgi:hypothetical protein